METYTEAKALVENPHYQDQRRECLAALSDGMIDEPIVELVKAFNELPHCFTLQSCYGHFVYDGQSDPHNLEPLPSTDTIARVEYRIAYVAFCIENSDSGKTLLDALRGITAVDPDNVQLCSAQWTWKQQVNSYALQVEPDRFKREDTAVLDYEEALKIERVRNEFFARLKESIRRQKR